MNFIPGPFIFSRPYKSPLLRFPRETGEQKKGVGLANATNGIISAKYEYGPFGEVFCSVGDMAKVNPFQFSTKVLDE
jgi:hypothetical protein